MNEAEYKHPDTVSETLSQSPLPLSRRFRARTILIPLAFLAIHWLMMNLVALAYMLVYMAVQGISGNTDVLIQLSDSANLQKLILDQYPIITVIYAAILIPIYAVFLRSSRRRDARSLMIGPVKPQYVIASLIMMIGTLGVTTIWFGILTALSERFAFIGAMMDDYLKTAGAFTPTTGYFWLILGISIMAPVVEELLFRGVIQGELRKAMPDWAAIIIQAVIFALFHIQPIQVSYVLLPGLLLGLAYYWTKSIWVPIGMHISFNFVGSVIPALIGDQELQTTILAWSEIAFILFGILAGSYLYLNHRRKSAVISPEK